MPLTKISINNFRCFEGLEISLSPGVNFFYGANGSGKTSILEAAFIFSSGKSFKSSNLTSLIKHNRNNFLLKAYDGKRGYVAEIKKNIEKILDDNKAQSITSINLKNKSYIADYMIIASGTSSRHLQSLSEILVNELKKKGIENCRIEGKDSNDWKLVDAHDVIVHIFHPEKREFYDLEKMWSEEIPKEKAMI